MFEIQDGMTRFGSSFINWIVHSGSLQSDDIDPSIVLGNILQLFLWSFLPPVFFASLSALTLVIGCTPTTLMKYLLSSRHCDTLEDNRSYKCLDNAWPWEVHRFLSFCMELWSRKLVFFLDCETQKEHNKTNRLYLYVLYCCLPFIYSLLLFLTVYLLLNNL